MVQQLRREHRDPITGSIHRGTVRGCHSLNCWRATHPNEEDLMGMRGKVTDEGTGDTKRSEKLELMQTAILERELSWTISKFSSKERWDFRTYSAVIDDHGGLTITDRDTDADVVSYAAAGVDWHGVRLEVREGGAWEPYLPEVDWQSWKAEQDDKR